MHEFRAHGSAVNAAGLIGQLAFDTQAGMRYGRQKSERVEIGLQVSPVAERVKYALTFAVRSFQDAGAADSLAGLDRVAICLLLE